MTYKQLSAAILAMPQDVQNCDVTVVLTQENEVYPMKSLGRIISGGEWSDILDLDHPIILIDAWHL